MKQLLIILALLVPLQFFAQEVPRVEVVGKITAPAVEDLEGISIYNISSQKGTVTNELGEFKLFVAELDYLQITALQFISFRVVVSAADIYEKELRIYLNPSVNQLDPVLISRHNLTGYPELDAKNIKTSVFTQELDLSYAALEFGYNFENDGQSPVTGNAAEDALGLNAVPQASVDILKLVELFFPRKRKSSREITDSRMVATNTLLKRFEHDYFVLVFEIPEAKVNDFVFFAEENGLTSAMLKRENEMELMSYLFQQSEVYKKRFNE